MLTSLTPRHALLLLLVVSIATIAGAWIFEAAGYLPCELCLMQRWAYYAAIPLTAVLLVAAPLQRAGLYLLALLWIGSMIFGIFHSGVEWKWWAGPTACTGSGGLSTGLPDLSSTARLCGLIRTNT